MQSTYTPAYTAHTRSWRGRNSSDFHLGRPFRRSGKRECVKARKLEKAFRFGAGRIKVPLFLLAAIPSAYPLLRLSSRSFPLLHHLSHPLRLLSRGWKAKIEAYASRPSMLASAPPRFSPPHVCASLANAHACTLQLAARVRAHARLLPFSRT